MSLAAGVALTFLLQGVAVASAGASGAAAADYGGCASPTLARATVAETLNVASRDVDYPLLTAKTVIKIPDTWPDIAALRTDPYGSVFRSALGCFLPMEQGDYRNSAPSVIESDGAVVVTDTITDTQDPFSPGDILVGQWRVTTGHREGTLEINSGIAYAAQAKWSVTIDTGGLQVVRWGERRPTSDDGNGRLAWQGLTASMLAGVSVDVRWPERIRADWSIGIWPYKAGVEVAWNAGYLAIFIPPLIMLRKYRKHRLLPGSPRTDGVDPHRLRLRLLATLCGTAVAVTAASILDDFAADQLANITMDDTIGRWLFGDARFSFAEIQARIEIALLLLLAAWLFLLAWPVNRRWIAWLRTGAVTAVAIAACVMQDRPEWWGPTATPISQLADATLLLRWSAATFRFLLLTSLPLLLAIFFLVSAMVGVIIRLCPVNLRGRPRSQTAVRRRTVALVQLSALLVAVLTVAQIAHAADLGWRRQSILGNGQPVGQLNWMATWILNAPHWFWHSEIQSILVQPVIVGALALINAMTRVDRTITFPRSRRSAEVTALAYVFAVLGVGTWGENVTLGLPVACAISYLLLRRFALDTRVESLESGLRITTAGTWPPRTGQLAAYQGILLDAADERSRLRKELADLDRGVSPAVGNESTAQHRARLAATLDELSHRWQVPAHRATPGTRHRLRPNRSPGEPPQETVELPGRIDPGQTALRLGPKPSWWENGWYAARVSVVPALAMVGYYTYYYVGQGTFWQASDEFAVINVLISLVQQLAGWLALAFVFGALYAYLRGSSGPVKGTMMGSVIAAATITDAIPTFVLGGTPYNRFLIDSLITLLYLVIVGVLMDGRTLALHQRALGRIATLYHLATLRVALTYAATLLIALIGFWQQAHVEDKIAQERAQIATEVLRDARQQANVSNSGAG